MKLVYRFLIVVLIFGVTLTWMGGKDFFVMSKDPVDLAEADWGTLEKGDHVVADIDLIWDCLYTQTTEETTYGIKTDEYESARGYVIPHLYIDNQGYYNVDYFIGLKVSKTADFPIMDRIMEETNAWYFDETGRVDYGMTTYHVDGILVKMSDEELDFMMEYLVDYTGYTKQEAQQMICPYMIQNRQMGPVRTTFIIGIVCDLIVLGFGVYWLITYFKEKNEFAAHTYMGGTKIDNGPREFNLGEVYEPKKSVGSGTYGESGIYGGEDAYGQSSYGQNTYGGTNSYGQNTYGGTNSYGQNTYGGTNTYGQDNGGSTDFWPKN